jgi:ATP-dependent helicase/nuclease subunit B
MAACRDARGHSGRRTAPRRQRRVAPGRPSHHGRKQGFHDPPGAPFLPTLADALLAGRLVDLPEGDGFGLADLTIYLPSRRGRAGLSPACWASAPADGARLLPRIVPLGEADEAEFDIAALPESAAAPGGLLPPIPPLERRLLLTRLVQHWARTVDARSAGPEVPLLLPASPADAVALAASLER